MKGCVVVAKPLLRVVQIGVIIKNYYGNMPVQNIIDGDVVVSNLQLDIVDEISRSRVVLVLVVPGCLRSKQY